MEGSGDVLGLLQSLRVVLDKDASSQQKLDALTAILQGKGTWPAGLSIAGGAETSSRPKSTGSDSAGFMRSVTFETAHNSPMQGQPSPARDSQHSSAQSYSSSASVAAAHSAEQPFHEPSFDVFSGMPSPSVVPALSHMREGPAKRLLAALDRQATALSQATQRLAVMEAEARQMGLKSASYHSVSDLQAALAACQALLNAAKTAATAVIDHDQGYLWETQGQWMSACEQAHAEAEHWRNQAAQLRDALITLESASRTEAQRIDVELSQLSHGLASAEADKQKLAATAAMYKRDYDSVSSLMRTVEGREKSASSEAEILRGRVRELEARVAASGGGSGLGAGGGGGSQAGCAKCKEGGMLASALTAADANLRATQAQLAAAQAQLASKDAELASHVARASELESLLRIATSAQPPYSSLSSSSVSAAAAAAGGGYGGSSAGYFGPGAAAGGTGSGGYGASGAGGTGVSSNGEGGRLGGHPSFTSSLAMTGGYSSQLDSGGYFGPAALSASSSGGSGGNGVGTGGGGGGSYSSLGAAPSPVASASRMSQSWGPSIGTGSSGATTTAGDGSGAGGGMSVQGNGNGGGNGGYAPPSPPLSARSPPASRSASPARMVAGPFSLDTTSIGSGAGGGPGGAAWVGVSTSTSAWGGGDGGPGSRPTSPSRYAPRDVGGASPRVQSLVAKTNELVSVQDAAAADACNVRHASAISRDTEQEDLRAFAGTKSLLERCKEIGMASSQLIIGIDCTKSNLWNGTNSFQGRSLHDVSDPSQPNPYQQVMSACCTALKDFDDDGLIPLYGFGCSRTQDHSVFPFRPGPAGSGVLGAPCAGLDDVLATYTAVIPTVPFAGPTSFAPLIKLACDIVRKEKQFTVLLIIADGQVTAVKETEAAIVEASRLPLSIICIGVGDGPWEEMDRFDDGLPQRKVDNFQFVELNSLYAEFGSGQGDRTFEDFLAMSAFAELPHIIPAMIKSRILPGLGTGQYSHLLNTGSGSRQSMSGSPQPSSTPSSPVWGATGTSSLPPSPSVLKRRASVY